MSSKKSYKVDIGKRKIIFFCIGLIVPLFLSLLCVDLLAVNDEKTAIIQDEPEAVAVQEYTPPETNTKEPEVQKQEVQLQNTEILLKVVDNTAKANFTFDFGQDVGSDDPVPEWKEPEVIIEPIELPPLFIFRNTCRNFREVLKH